jgi:hypothetical protein
MRNDTCQAETRVYSVVHPPDQQPRIGWNIFCEWNRLDESEGLTKACEKVNTLKTKRKPFHLKTQSVPRSKHFSSLKTKRKLFHLKTQSVPRSKHFSSRLQEQINLCYIRQKSVFVVI